MRDSDHFLPWRFAILGILALYLPGFAGVARAETLPGPRLPTYFIADLVDEELKFQIDLTLPVFTTASQQSLLYGAYQQRSHGGLSTDEPPFRVQTNFSPEVGCVLGADLGRPLVNGWPQVLSLSASYVHESNGTEGIPSRGWNRFIGGIHLGRRDSALRASLLLWHGFRVESTNEDLRRYAGDGEVRVAADLGSVFGPRLDGSSLLLRSAFSPHAYHDRWFTNLEAGLYVHPRFLPSWFFAGEDGPAIDLLAEWFVGTGEFLYGYKESVNRLRIGIALRSPFASER